ncbi:MAG: DUF4080 domain-containing protein [Clostridia bacterium]|nr:DUF4080 domain-containing protein [Clostridia bacterium]
MRVTICSLSSQYIHMPLSPLCLKRAAEEAYPQADVTICDANINDTKETLLRRLMAGVPDVIALSVYIWNREMTALMVRRIKAMRPETVIILGGPEVTWDAAGAMAEMPCDYVLRGAGEESLPALLRIMAEGGDPAEVESACFRTPEGVHIGTVAPSPAPREDLYDEAWQRLRAGRMIYCETSRGCPFACAFCLSGHRERVQFMPRETALEMLIRLGNQDVDTVKLIDRTFNCSAERTKFLLGGLIDAKRQGRIGEVCYHLEVAADLFDEETLALLADAPAGLFQMEAGLQSFHPATLESCNRRTDMAKLENNLRALIGAGNIHLHIDLIAGLPEEDFAEFGRSFDKAWSLRPHQLQLGFLKVIHGSALRSRDWGARFSPDPPYEVLSTPWMSYEELCRLQDCAEAVEKIANSGRFAETLALALAQTGMRPFELFLLLGARMSGRRWSVDALTQLVQETLLSLGVDAAALRDALVLDRLAADNTGYLPPCIAGDAAALKIAARAWREAHPEDRRARTALSADGGTLFVASWEKKHPVTERGEVRQIPISEKK